jgi:hypothetical protein
LVMVPQGPEHHCELRSAPPRPRWTHHGESPIPRRRVREEGATTSDDAAAPHRTPPMRRSAWSSPCPGESPCRPCLRPPQCGTFWACRRPVPEGSEAQCERQVGPPLEPGSVPTRPASDGSTHCAHEAGVAFHSAPLALQGGFRAQKLATTRISRPIYWGSHALSLSSLPVLALELLLNKVLGKERSYLPGAYLLILAFALAFALEVPNGRDVVQKSKGVSFTFAFALGTLPPTPGRRRHALATATGVCRSSTSS